MSMYEIYKRLTNEELRAYFNKADTVEEKDFWSALVQLRAKEIKINQLYNNSEKELFNLMDEVICENQVTLDELKEIKELDRLEWQEDVIEDITEKTIEEKMIEERIRLARNFLDVLDNETIAEKTGLDIDLIKSLRI